MSTWQERVRDWVVTLLTPQKITDGTMGHLTKIWQAIRNLESNSDPALEEKIVSLGDTATGMLLTALNHRDPYIRLRIVRILGQLKDNRAVDDLIARLKDPAETPVVTEAAIGALVLIKTDRAITSLAGIILKGEGKEVWLAASALERIGQASISAVIALLYGPPVTKAIAVAVLRRITGESYGDDPSEWGEWQRGH